MCFAFKQLDNKCVALNIFGMKSFIMVLGYRQPDSNSERPGKLVAWEKYRRNKKQAHKQHHKSKHS